tara:strand:+ start:1159 stop:1536 length:378 start_codon:yes stop_codon:yes gene_type:complete
MALSNLNKENITNLFNMLHIRDNNEKLIETIKGNYASYARLELISKQMEMLRREAESILTNHQINLDFQKIQCNFKKVPGNYYYVYENKDIRFLSIISPNEWFVPPEKFITKVLFDYDNIFYTIN